MKRIGDSIQVKVVKVQTKYCRCFCIPKPNIIVKIVNN